MKNIPGKGNSQCKGPGVGLCLVCWRNSKEPVCLEQSEGEGRGRRGGQGGDGAGRAGPCGPPGGLELLPPGRWEPWGAVSSEEAEPDSGAHRRPLAVAGRTDCGGRGGEVAGRPGEGAYAGSGG